jgi:predicted negative regulator of RcsB-dependent stress response
MKQMEDKKELERLKKVLLTNLTNQIQLLLDFKSRTVEEKVKNIITQRIAKVNAEMKQVNALKDVDEINSKYGEDMLGPLDVTLRVQQGTC